MKVALAAFTGVAALGAITLANPSVVHAQSSEYRQLQEFSGVLNHIRLNYVDSVAYTDLVPAAITGVLRSLDPHSRYLSAEDLEQLGAFDRGEIGSVGITLEEVGGEPTIVSLARAGPAIRSGLMPGDRLTMVNDTSVAGLDAEDLTLDLLGPPGTEIRLAVERGPRLEPEGYRVELVREIVENPSVSTTLMVDDSTGLVRLEVFGPDAAAAIRSAFQDLGEEGARRFILDLRGNPGGLLDQAAEVATEFLARNTVVFETRGRHRDMQETRRSERQGKLTSQRLVLLIDQNSASASEVLAGALQDHRRAMVVGRRSFGKALVQTDFPLRTGGVVRLTVGRVMTPSGRFIQRRFDDLAPEQYADLAGAGDEAGSRNGITPDYAVEPPPALPVWFSAAADRRLIEEVADSVAHTLPATSDAEPEWAAGPAEALAADVVEPFLLAARDRLEVAAEIDSELERRIGRILARRVAEVRWGPEAAERFELRTDPDVIEALEAFR